MGRTAASIALMLIALAAPAGAQAPIPAPAHSSGFVRVGAHAIAFLPEAAPGQKQPLLVLFHGAGQTAQDMMKPFIGEASKRGLALLAVQSKGPTWDLITSHFEAYPTSASRIGGALTFPPGDRRDADSAIAELEARFPIDASRVGVLGFSDGASYAMTYGAHEPRRIAWVGGFSGAFAIIPPGTGAAAQRVFIAHGTQDDVLPFRQARDSICPEFLRTGRTVRFRAFDNGHVMSRAVIRDALDDFLDPATRPPAGSSDYRCGH